GPAQPRPGLAGRPADPRRRRGHPRRAARRGGGLRVPELPADAGDERAGQRGAAAGTARQARRRGRARPAGAGRTGPAPRPPAAPAVRRRTAARRDRARVRGAAADPVRRRTHRQPRPQDRACDRGPAVRHGCRAAHHRGHRHPRRTPGRALRPPAAAGRRAPAAVNVASVVRMAARQAWQGWRNGEFGVLLAALFVAVLALAGVGSIAQRTTDALAEQSRRLVGGDAAFSSDDGAIDAARAHARELGLRSYRSVELVSMVAARGTAPQLGGLKALAGDAPLLGPYTVRTADGLQRLPRPAAGPLWLSASGAQRLHASPGDSIEVGGRALRLAGIVVEEPDRPLNGVELGPRVILPLSEVEAGGLLGPGARASWRIAVAGPQAAVRAWVQAREADPSPGARVETGDDLSPQLRNALDRAQRFLSVSLVLTAAL